MNKPGSETVIDVMNNLATLAALPVFVLLACVIFDPVTEAEARAQAVLVLVLGWMITLMLN